MADIDSQMSEIDFQMLIDNVILTFCEFEGKWDLDKSHTICKLCQAKLKYLVNTTNMTNHITSFQPEEEG